MKRSTTRAIFAALSIGISAFAVSAVQSAPAIKIENKALADAITGAQNDAKAGRYTEALAKAKQADAIQGKPADLTRAVHQMIVSYAISAKDYATALAEIDKMIAGNEGNKTELLGQAFSISLQAGNQQKAQAYADQMGSNKTPQIRLVIASGYAKAKKYKEAIDEVQPLLQSGQPSEPLLLFLQATYNEMGDAPKRRDVLEQLVASYPKPQYWHDLLLLARNERGHTDEQTVDILRLRLAVGDMKTDADYFDLAQMTLLVGYPNEAKAVLDKGAAAKVVAGERVGRMMKMATDNSAKDTALQADLQGKAGADANASLKLGMLLWSYGKYPEAETAVRNAMKGKLADPDAAKVALGHVLFSAGKKPDAVNAFNSVAKNSKWSSVARLWSIYARRG